MNIVSDRRWVREIFRVPYTTYRLSLKDGSPRGTQPSSFRTPPTVFGATYYLEIVQEIFGSAVKGVEVGPQAGFPGVACGMVAVFARV